MEKLRISKYAILFTYSHNNNNEKLVYCSRTNSFLKLPEELFKQLLAIQKDPDNFVLSTISESNLMILKKTKILVSADDDDNFIREYELKTHLKSFVSSNLSLSIAPTSACNFRCPYCYEKSKPNYVMNDSTISHLIEFINSHRLAKYLYITWYGGEPLISFEIIKKILERIDNECVATIKGQSIVTNGYNFNNDVIEFFLNKKLSDIQITLDGTEESHNKTRILANGTGTFQQIYENIKNIVKRLPDTRLKIRMNVGKNNRDEYVKLYNMLKTDFQNKVTLYPGFLRIDDDEKTKLICDSMLQTDIIDFKEELEKKNIATSLYPKLNPRIPCVATSVNAYVVGPLGELYKCWNDIGDEKMIVGYLNQPKLTNPNLYNRYIIDGRWTSSNECRECFFLPICNGGCAWQRLRNKYYHGEYNFCDLYKGKGIDHILTTYYEIYKNSSDTIRIK